MAKYHHMKKIIISESQIQTAADIDSANQTSYDLAYDRKRGFIEGAKWAIRMMSPLSYNEIQTGQTVMDELGRIGKVTIKDDVENIQVTFSKSHSEYFSMKDSFLYPIKN